MAIPLIGAACLFFTVVVGWSPYGQRVNHIFYDLYFRQRGPEPPNENIAIVAIDDATLAENGPLPLDRAKLAQGIREIAAANPSVIALDLLLTDPKPEDDLALRRAIGGEPSEGILARRRQEARERTKKPPPAPGGMEDLESLGAVGPFSRTPVVLASALDAGGDGRWLNPRPEFALSAAAVGHVHADPDGDGVSRQVLLEKQGGMERYWAFGLECFRVWLGAAPQPITETDDSLQVPSATGPVSIPAVRRDGRALLINYAGDRNSFPEVSFSRLGKDPAAAEELRGRIVLVGVTAQGSGDRLFTPFSAAGMPMAGVEIHANILNTLMNNEYLVRAGNAKELMGMLAVIIAVIWGMVRLRGMMEIVWMIALGAFVLTAPYGRFLEGEVWPAFSLLLAYGTSLGAGEAYQLLVARRSFHESEARRRQSQQRFEMAAHEMRTPLASIQASSELLANYALDDARRGQMTQLLQDESQRLSRLVERFLSVERLSAGEMELRREPVELTSLLAALIERLRPLAARKGVRLVEPVDPPPIEIAADPELLEFAVSNLVTNAVKYSPAGAEVRVEWESDGQQAGIHVADNGPGMAPEESRRVFDRFYRTDAAQASENPGFGLGLSIAREIARHHGGDIRVETRPGAGSRFTIVLPLTRLAESPGAFSP